MKYAAIDIGSNTVLLLVAEAVDGNLSVLYEKQHIPRLGKGVDSSGNLNNDCMRKALKALADYKSIIEDNFSASVPTVVTATSAVRDANNRGEFLSNIKSETGYDVALLSGMEEARYTFIGSLSTLEGRSQNSLVIDIGGGSTELCYGRSKRIESRYSFQMGSVRFTEKYLPDEHPSNMQVEGCRREISALLNLHPIDIKPATTLVGIAGTVTSLAHIISGNKEYNSDLLNGMRLQKQQLSEVIEGFITKGSGYYLQHYNSVMKGRSDVLLAGLLILDETMNHYGFGELTVSSGGIRHGAILETFL